MADYGFGERLQFSMGERSATDIQTLRKMITGATSVSAAPKQLDLMGVDYIATLGGNDGKPPALVNVDIKRRQRGSRKYWNRGWEPDLALEHWSVLPENGFAGKIGWTLNESSITDLVLFTFDAEDTNNCYLLGFQPLRIAFRRHFYEWRDRFGGVKEQSSNGRKWKSAAICVPATAVLDGIARIARGEYCAND